MGLARGCEMVVQRASKAVSRRIVVLEVFVILGFSG